MQAGKLYEFTCQHCGHVERRAGDKPPQKCPRCSTPLWNMKVQIGDCVSSSDEFTAEGTDRTGRLALERIDRMDANTRATLSSDLGQPSNVSIARSGPVDSFSEEGRAVEMLVQAYNQLHSGRYEVEPKDREDYKYADRCLTSEAGMPTRIPVQVRALDPVASASLGKNRSFQGLRTGADFARLIEEAVHEKALIDSELRATTLLLLVIPTPIGLLLREEIQQISFDKRGFKEVWICCLREECFRLA